MANVNVNRSVDDAFYRYKMPKLIAKVEGKGNGIKTVIVNMSDVSKALSRPPTYPTKYFGCELGAQTQFDNKNDRYIVNGSHDSIRLQDLLDGFIKRFVLCQECDNPETNLVVQARQGNILQRCIACGHQGNIDMRHKLTTFILKNPPDQDPTSATPNKKDKRQNKKDKKAAKGEATENNTDGTSKRKKVKEDDDQDVDWGEDTSEEAVKKRMEELSDAAKIMTVSEDTERSENERVDIFYNFVKDKKEKSLLTGTENIKVIVAEAERLDVKEKAPMVLVELLYDTNILTQIPKYRMLFLIFTANNKKAQKYLLGGLEQLVGVVFKDALMAKVPRIFKAFYDCDILEEEAILEWDSKASKKYVSKEVSKEIHAKAAPFIKWLEEAEEESDEEDEEEDVEVVYSTTGKVGTQAIPKETSNKAEEKDDEDDLNIDEI